MGYVRNDAVIVTVAGYVADPVVPYRGDPRMPDVETFRQSIPQEYRHLVIGPVPHVVNGGVTYAFLPDGSKEGFDESVKCDRLRQQFIDLFAFVWPEDDSSPFDVVATAMRWGGNEPGDGYEPELIVRTVRGGHVGAEVTSATTRTA